MLGRKDDWQLQGNRVRKKPSEHSLLLQTPEAVLGHHHLPQTPQQSPIVAALDPKFLARLSLSAQDAS